VIGDFLTSFYSKERIGKSRASARREGITPEEAAALAELLLQRFEVAPKVKAKPKRPRSLASPTPAKSKVMKVTLRLRVETTASSCVGRRRPERPSIGRS
jgi:hypothetical protein